MTNAEILEGDVEERDEIDIQEVLQQTLDGMEGKGGDELRRYFREQDKKLDLIGIRIGDSEHLDPDVYLENPLLAGLWILGQFRTISDDLEEGDILSYMQLIFAWEEFARAILEME